MSIVAGSSCCRNIQVIGKVSDVSEYTGFIYRHKLKPLRSFSFKCPVVAAPVRRAPYLIDLHCVANKQGVLLLLLLLALFIHEVGKPQTDAQHHAWR